MIARRTATLVALTLCLTSVESLHAQNVLGLRAGANFATLGGSDADSPGTRTGLNLGASVTFPVGDNLGIHLGGAYSQKGAEQSEEGITFTLAIDYVEIPVLLKVGIPSESSASAHFFVGPVIAFEAACEGEVSGQGGSISVDCDQAEVDTKNIDFGAMGGVGVDISVSEGLILSFDAFYSLGLTSIDDSGDDVKNRAFTLQAGLGFPIG